LKAQRKAPSTAPAQSLAPGQATPRLDALSPLVEGFGQAADTSKLAADPELTAFLRHGAFGPLALTPPTGIGGFTAQYSPATGQLLILIQGSIDFIDGLALAGGVFTADHSDLDQAAVDGNSIVDPAMRSLFLADFQWGEEQTEWVATLQGNVESTWSQQFSFMVDKPGWEGVLASVLVDADIAQGICRPGDHVAVSTYKVPDSGAYDVGAFVGPTGQPTGNTMTLSSRDVRRSEQATADGDSLLQRSVGPFGFDRAALPSGGRATLDAFAADFIDANNDLTNPVTIIGRASSDGSEQYNIDLGQRRAATVASSLRGRGFSDLRVTTSSAGEEGASTDAEWRRVDLVVGDGQAQSVGSHEFGHMLGLGDHYDNAGTDSDGDGVADRGGTIDGTGQSAGSLADHDQLARDIGVVGGAIHENNDNIRSLGHNVDRSNYATVGWALQTLTGMPEWKVL